MTELTLSAKLQVVSHLARGRTTQWIADGMGLPIDAVRQIGREHGAPDMGKLAAASDALRKQLDAGATVRAEVEGKPVPGGITASTGIEQLLKEAERIESPRLVSRGRDLAQRLTQYRTDLAAASKQHAGKAEKAGKLARLAELKAEEARIRAELRGSAAPVVKATTRKAAAPKQASESAVIRRWAKGAGVVCPEFGRIPGSVRDAYANRNGVKA